MQRNARGKWSLWPGVLACLCGIPALIFAGYPARAQESQGATGKALRIIVFGAHPDDCELRSRRDGGAMGQAGYKVKFVSVTNGDIGHHQMAGGHARPPPHRGGQASAPRSSVSRPRCWTTTTAS